MSELRVDRQRLARTLAAFRAIEDEEIDLTLYAGQYVALVVRNGKTVVGAHDISPGRLFWDVPQEDVAAIILVNVEGRYPEIEPLTPKQRRAREQREDTAGA